MRYMWTAYTYIWGNMLILEHMHYIHIYLSSRTEYKHLDTYRYIYICICIRKEIYVHQKWLMFYEMRNIIKSTLRLKVSKGKKKYCLYIENNFFTTSFALENESSLINELENCFQSSSCQCSTMVLKLDTLFWNIQ